jgi:hypothetical protein
MKITEERKVIVKFCDFLDAAPEDAFKVVRLYATALATQLNRRKYPDREVQDMYARAPIFTFNQVLQRIEVGDVKKFWLRIMAERQWVDHSGERALCFNGDTVTAADRSLYKALCAAAYAKNEGFNVRVPRKWVEEQLFTALARTRIAFALMTENVPFKELHK